VFTAVVVDVDDVVDDDDDDDDDDVTPEKEGRRLLIAMDELRTIFNVCAVFTGTVLFSTTMRCRGRPPELAQTREIIRAASSTFLRSLASPDPTPNFFVGVCTQTMRMSAAAMSVS
jgi:hypothetical protein